APVERGRGWARRRGLLGAAGTSTCLVALAGVLFACHHGGGEEVETTNAVPVTVVAARRGDVRAVVIASGTVVPAPGAELGVGAPGPARVAELPHGEGDRVRRGELLVRFEVPNLDADVAAKRADLERGTARLAAARASYERLSGLLARDVAAKKEVDDA